MVRVSILFAAMCIFLGAPLRAAGPVEWQPVGLSGGGAMFNPVISPADPKMAIVHCDMSAAYLTHDGGASWEMIPTSQLRSNTRCRAAFDPMNRDVIYSPHGASALKVSRDGGKQWETLAQFDAALTGPIVVDPRNGVQMLIGVGETVRYSVNAGKTWGICDGVSGTFAGGYFRSGGVMFVGTNKGLWQSTDSGRSWKDLSAGLPSKEVRSLAGGTKDGQTTVYCTVPGKVEGGKYMGGIYRWTSERKTWQPAGTEGLVLDIKAFDQWARTPVTQFFDVATSDEHPEMVWCANQGAGVPVPHHCTLYASKDSGKTWEQTFFPDPRFKSFNVEKSYMAAEDGQYYQSVLNISEDPHNAGHVLAISDGDCFITNDSGKSWQCGSAKAVGDAKPGARWKCTGLVVTTTWNYYIDPHQSNRHYICYTDIGFARSLDAGQTWLWWSEKDFSPWRNTCYALAFDPDRAGKMWGAFSEVHDIPHANIIYARHSVDREGGVCVSDDFAATWKPLAGSLPKAPATSIVLDPKSPKNARTLYAAFFGKGVYKSVDDGQTWVSKSVGLSDPENMRVYTLHLHADGTLFALVTAMRKNNQFVQAGAGVYRSTNGGDSWECITKTVSALWPKDFTVDPADSKTIYLGLADANGKQTGGLYRTIDGGASWNLLFREGREHFGAYLSPHHKGWIYATLCEDAPKYGLYLSKDNGKTFDPITAMPFDNAMRVAFDPADPAVIYVTTFGGSVWKGPAE